ncbi:MAG: hypothetical protein AAF740_03875, partial [Bacteroidota bacterium]
MISYYSDGLQSVQGFWEEWAAGKDVNIIPDLLLAGREKEKLEVTNALSQDKLVAIQSQSREESLAFIIATLIFFKGEDESNFLDRCIIVDSEDVFRKLSNYGEPLILISRFGDKGVLNYAIQRGHTVLVPLGMDASDLWEDKIILPLPARNKFSEALEKMGLSSEKAESYTRESARNILVLRRYLKCNRERPEWASEEYMEDLFPLLLVNRWNESEEGDRQILSFITDRDYSICATNAKKWLNTKDAPFLKFGNEWRWAAPFDAWTHLFRFLDSDFLDRLEMAFVEVLGERNPAFDLPPENRYAANIYGKNLSYSNWLREGIAQTMVLISVIEDPASEKNYTKWVNKVVFELLSEENPEIWKSLGSHLPLIAEASPTGFLEALEKHLNSENNPVRSLFSYDPSPLSSIRYHTGLLWALESVAWFPEHFSRVVMILAKLTGYEPSLASNLQNRPSNTLLEIFRPWHYQTLASFEERMDVFWLLSQKYPEITWEYMIKLLPSSIGQTGNYNHKMRWRMMDYELSRATNKEVFDTYQFFISLTLESTLDDNKAAQLLESSTNFDVTSREKVLDHIKIFLSENDYHAPKTLKELRRILSQHRVHSQQDWALPEEQLAGYEKLFRQLSTNSLEERFAWLFGSEIPEFPDKQERTLNYRDREKLANKKREELAKEIYDENGLSWFLDTPLLYENE